MSLTSWSSRKTEFTYDVGAKQPIPVVGGAITRPPLVAPSTTHRGRQRRGRRRTSAPRTTTRRVQSEPALAPLTPHRDATRHQEEERHERRPERATGELADDKHGPPHHERDGPPESGPDRTPPGHTPSAENRARPPTASNRINLPTGRVKPPVVFMASMHHAPYPHISVARSGRIPAATARFRTGRAFSPKVERRVARDRRSARGRPRRPAGGKAFPTHEHEEQAFHGGPSRARRIAGSSACSYTSKNLRRRPPEVPPMRPPGPTPDRRRTCRRGSSRVCRPPRCSRRPPLSQAQHGAQAAAHLFAWILYAPCRLTVHLEGPSGWGSGWGREQETGLRRRLR